MSQGEINGRFDVDYLLKKVNNHLKFRYPTINIGDIENIQVKKGIFDLSPDNYKNEGIPFLRVADLKGGTIVKNSLVYIDEEINNKEKNTQLLPGDLVFSKVGTIDEVSILPNEFPVYNMSQNIIGVKIRNNNSIIPDYLRNIFQLSFGKQQLIANSMAGVQPKITLDSIKDIKIPLPSLEVQKKIVDKMNNAVAKKKKMELESEKTLESIDDYVLSELGIKLPKQNEEKNYFIVNLEDIKHGRIDVFYNKPEFKEIEKQFFKINNVVELKDIIDYIRTGTTPNTKKEPFSSEGIPFLRNTNLQKNGITTNDLKYIKNEYKDTLTYSEKDDILICIAGTIGVSSVNNFGKIAINQNVSSLKIKQGISPYFISYLLNTKIFSEFFDRVSSVATIKYINNDNLLSIKIPLPPIEIQDKIANEVKSRIEKANELKKQANEIYEQAKNGVEKMILE